MSDQPSSSPSFIISREFDAPRDVLWKAWTDPEEMKQWLGPAMTQGWTGSLDQLTAYITEIQTKA